MGIWYSIITALFHCNNGFAANIRPPLGQVLILQDIVVFLKNDFSEYMFWEIIPKKNKRSL